MTPEMKQKYSYPTPEVPEIINNHLYALELIKKILGENNTDAINILFPEDCEQKQLVLKARENIHDPKNIAPAEIEKIFTLVNSLKSTPKQKEDNIK